MQDQGISQAFTNDRHFEQAGFTTAARPNLGRMHCCANLRGTLQRTQAPALGASGEKR
jgi:hypothetical protein